MSVLLFIATPDRQHPQERPADISDPDTYEEHGTVEAIKLFSTRDEALIWATEYAAKRPIATEALTPAYAISFAEVEDTTVVITLKPDDNLE